MKFLEKDLEDIIYTSLKDRANGDILKSRGFPIDMRNDFHVERQLKLGRHGIADIVIFNSVHNCESSANFRYINVDVFELKKGVINSDAIGQGLRYKTFLENYMGYHFPSLQSKINLYLIGSDIDRKSDCVFTYNELFRGGEFTIMKYEYLMNGIFFRRIAPTFTRNGETFQKVDAHERVRESIREMSRNDNLVFKGLGVK